MPTKEITLLSSRRFLPLFMTQFLGAFNDNLFKNALVILITYRLNTITSFTPQTLVIFAAGIFILPFLLFSAIAGQLADKYEKSGLIRLIKLIEIIIALFAGLGFYTQNVYLLLLTLFAFGTHSAFFGPLKYAILPDQLPNDELIAGNGLIEAGTFIAILIGTLFGGTLVLLPQANIFLSIALIAVAVCGWQSSRYINATQPHQPDLTLNYHLIQETSRLLRYACQSRAIFLSIFGISWFWLFGGILLAEFPVFTKDVLHAEASIVTLFLTIFSVGLGIGSLFCNQLLKGQITTRYVPFGIFGMSLFTIDLCLASTYAVDLPHHELVSFHQFLSTIVGWRISLDLLATAICAGIYTVPLYAMMQARSATAHRARIIASNNIMNAIFMVISSLATLLLLQLGLSVTHIFLSLAIANCLIGAYMYFYAKY